MTVNKFCRETDIVAHHRVDALLVFVESRGLREHYPNATGRKESVPEGEFLIHIEDAWDADSEDRVRHLGGRVFGTVKELVIFAVAHINADRIGRGAVGENLFALVARIEDTAVVEFVLRNLALVFAAFAGERFLVEASAF